LCGRHSAIQNGIPFQTNRDYTLPFGNVQKTTGVVVSN